jgi:hypothetical protein
MRATLKRADTHPFSLWLGFCLEKRKWIEQPEAIASVIERLRAQHGEILIIADGLTRTLAQSRDEFRAEACRAELARLDEFKRRFPDVEVIDLIGATAPEKIAFGLSCTMFVTSALTDSMWPGRFGARPGAAHASTGTLLATQHHPRTSVYPQDMTTDLESGPKAVFSTTDYSINPDLFTDYAWKHVVEPLSSADCTGEIDLIEGPPSAIEQRFGRWIINLDGDATITLAGAPNHRAKPSEGIAHASFYAEDGVEVQIGIATLRQRPGLNEPQDRDDGLARRTLHESGAVRPSMTLSGSGSAVIYDLSIKT